MIVKTLSGDTFPHCAVCLSDKVTHTTGPMVDIEFSANDNSTSVRITVAVHSSCLKRKLP